MNISFTGENLRRTLTRLQAISSLRGQAGVGESQGMTKLVVGNNVCLFSVYGAHIDEFRVECEAKTSDGSGKALLLPVQKLAEISKSIADNDDISLTMKEDDEKTVQITIAGQKTRFRIISGDAQDYPDAQEKAYSATITLLADDLVHLFKSVSFAMAVHDPRNYLNGVYLEHEKDKLTTVATNGHRLARSCTKVTEKTDTKANIIIPSEAVVQFERNASSLDKRAKATLSFGEGQIKLECQNETLIGRSLAGQFPDYNRVIPDKFKGTATVDREEMLAGLNKAIAILIGSTREQTVKMSIADGQIVILTETAEGDNAEVPVPAEYTGDAMEVGFNVSYLIDVFKTLATEKAVIQLQDNASAARIIGKDGGDDDYVVMPLRL